MLIRSIKSSMSNELEAGGAELERTTLLNKSGPKSGGGVLSRTRGGL